MSLLCPNCKSKTTVLETRSVKRRRQCNSCQARFNTIEIIPEVELHKVRVAKLENEITELKSENIIRRMK